MAWTQADLDAIDRAIAAGEKVVQYADRRVEYRSIQELLAARNAMKGNVTGGPTTDPSAEWILPARRSWT